MHIYKYIARRRKQDSREVLYHKRYIIFLELDATDQINKLRRQKKEGYEFIVIWRELKGTRPIQTL